MTRVATTNYGADATTQFNWATSGSDLFSRTLDLYYMSQALELHDHSAGRGLPVSRLAAGAVTAASITALSIDTTALANLSVTNAKLAAASVTLDKLALPFLQATNDFPGGLSLKDSASTYRTGWYVAANGIAAWGVGTVATVVAGLLMDQSRNVSVGAVAGTAKLNVMMGTDALASGLRVYNTNTAFFTDLANVGGNTALGVQGTARVWIESSTGRVTIGLAAITDSAFAISQVGGTATEGLSLRYGGGLGQFYQDPTGALVIRSVGTTIQLAHGSAELSPLVNGVGALGSTSFRWGNLFCAGVNASTLTLSAGASFAAGIAGTTASFSGAVTVGQLNSGSLVPNVTNTYSVGQAGGKFVGGRIGILIIDNNGIFPEASSTGKIGDAGTYWSSIAVDTANKTGGGSWAVLSDQRSKKNIRDYDHGLAEILALTPIYFQYNGRYGTPVDDRTFVGLIAQDAEKIMPEIVVHEQAMIDPRDPLSPMEDRLNLDASAMVFALTRAIQELEARVRDLEFDRRN